MWIKICGVCDEESARAVIDSAANALGLNFYAASKRCVSLHTAQQIVALLPESVRPVGVFVNHSPEEIANICRETGIGTVQLHGDESPEMAAALLRTMPELDLIRACRVGEDGLDDMLRELDAWRQLGISPFACLIDSRVKGQYGGTGAQAPWSVLRDEYPFETAPRLILAGGLTPHNVAEAVRIVRPWGVDVAGGVETSPGKKSPASVKQFVHAARAGGVTFPPG